MSTPNNKASLGCGTLILIALIVMIFGGANRDNDKEVAQQLRNLQSEVSSLKAGFENQSATLAQIKQSLDEINKRATQPRPRVVMPESRPRVAPDPTPELEAPLPLPEN